MGKFKILESALQQVKDEEAAARMARLSFAPSSTKADAEVFARPDQVGAQVAAARRLSRDVAVQAALPCSSCCTSAPKFLIIGGIHRRDMAELWSPARAPVKGTLAPPRYDHTATRLPSGLVLVCGGGDDKNTRLASCVLLDPRSLTSTPAAALPQPRDSHAAVALREAVFLAGGDTDKNTATASCLIHKDGAWTEVAPMEEARANFGLASNGRSVFACGGCVYVDGDVVLRASCERYDTTTERWTPLPPMPGGPRDGCAAVFGDDGRLYIIGGQEKVPTESGGWNYPYVGRVEILDPATETWSTGPSLKTPRWLSHGVVKVGGALWAMGGDGPTSVEVLDAGASEWRVIEGKLSGDIRLSSVVADF